MAKKEFTPEKVIRLYQKGFPLSAIQNLTGCPAEIASQIIKQAGLFNPKKQHDFYSGQTKNKTTN